MHGGLNTDSARSESTWEKTTKILAFVQLRQKTLITKLGGIDSKFRPAMPIKVNFNAHLKIYSKVPDKLALRLLILGFFPGATLLFGGTTIIDLDQIQRLRCENYIFVVYWY